MDPVAVVDTPIDWRMGGIRLPGGGPWRILAECPATVHCTERAARRRKPGCICPRGIAAAKETRTRWNARRRVKCQEKQVEMARTSAGTKGTVLAGQGRKYTNTMRQGVHVPDLGAGTCQSISGRKIIDKASNGKAAKGVEARAIAAIMCAHCPVLALCKGWIRAAEQPAGSWGGFIAGEGASTRRKNAPREGRGSDE